MHTAGERYPHLQVSVDHVPTPEQPELIASGQYDLGLSHPLFNITAGYPDVECRELLTDPMDGALLPVHHPLAVRDSVTFDDLADIPFLFFRRDFHTSFFDYLMESFRRQGYKPKLGPPHNGLHTLWSFCETGAGWSVAFASHRAEPPSGLVAVPIEGFKIPWGVNLLSRKNESRPAARAIIELLFEESVVRNAAAIADEGKKLSDAIAG